MAFGDTLRAWPTRADSYPLNLVEYRTEGEQIKKAEQKISKGKRFMYRINPQGTYKKLNNADYTEIIMKSRHVRKTPQREMKLFKIVFRVNPDAPDILFSYNLPPLTERRRLFPLFPLHKFTSHLSTSVPERLFAIFSNPSLPPLKNSPPSLSTPPRSPRQIRKILPLCINKFASALLVFSSSVRTRQPNDVRSPAQWCNVKTEFGDEAL